MNYDNTPSTLTKASLLELWHSAGKHGVYQQLPDFLRADFGVDAPVDERWRGDRSRLEYLYTRINFDHLKVVDIGANTGFFSLTLAHEKQCAVTAFEPDPENANFLRCIGEHYKLDLLRVHDQPLTISNIRTALPPSDLVLLLNVLHHAGDDFDSLQVKRPEDLSGYMEEYLSAVAQSARRMVFQLGYNWCGNKATPLLPVREPYSMLDYLHPILDAAGWDVDHIALRVDVESPRMIEIDPAPGRHAILTTDMDTALPGMVEMIHKKPLTRVSEFYARPLIICSSRNTGSREPVQN